MTCSTSAVSSEPSLEHFTGQRIVDQHDPSGQRDQTHIPVSVRAGTMPVPRGTSNREVAMSAVKHTDPAVLSPLKNADPTVKLPERAQLPPPPPAAAKPVIPRTRAELCETLARAADVNDLPAPFFIRLLYQESRFNPASVSPAGALGIAQFMPATAEGVGLDNPFDPVQAITASANLLRTLLERFGNLGLAAAAYNAGPRRVQEWIEKKGKLPTETQGYVKIVTGQPAENWKKNHPDPADMRVPHRAPCKEVAKLHAWKEPRMVPLPPSSPLRDAVQVAISAREDKSEADRKLAALIAMRSMSKRGKGAIQLSARAHEGKRGKIKN